MSNKHNWAIDPARLMDVLRSMKYSLGAAVADVIDNSLDAHAKKVDVLFSYDSLGHRYLIISDNGKGIPEADINQQLGIGGRRQYSPGEFGKFGVGLKLSSLSQAAELSIYSRVSAKLDTFRRLSANHIKSINRLEILESRRESEAASHAEKIFKKMKCGTLVLWENMDKYPLKVGDRNADAVHQESLVELRAYLGLVFSRLLAKNRTKIAVNGTPIEAIDPFAQVEKDTICRKKNILLNIGQTEHKVPLQFTILPHRSKFKSTRFWETMAIVKSANEAQGLYFYRNDRLILFGGWFGLREIEPHYTLAKIAIDIPEDLDEFFQIDPTKTAYVLPQIFLQELSAAISEDVEWKTGEKAVNFTKRAKQRYDTEGRKAKNTSGLITGQRAQPRAQTVEKISSNSKQTKANETKTVSIKHVKDRKRILLVQIKDDQILCEINSTHPDFATAMKHLRALD